MLMISNLMISLFIISNLRVMEYDMLQYPRIGHVLQKQIAKEFNAGILLYSNPKEDSK